MNKSFHMPYIVADRFYVIYIIYIHLQIFVVYYCDLTIIKVKKQLKNIQIFATFIVQNQTYRILNAIYI